MKLADHLEFIANRDSDDDGRIERIKDLLIDSDNFTADDRLHIARTLEEIIREQDEDVVLRQHAAIEIGYYCDSPSVVIRERFDDTDEDEDVRYNLQSSFEGHFPIETLRPNWPEQDGSRESPTR